jgi:hypothetical protein
MLVWISLAGLCGCMATEDPTAQLGEAQRLLDAVQPSDRCASLVTEALAAVDYARFEESAPDGRRFGAYRAEAALYKARQAAAACAAPAR